MLSYKFSRNTQLAVVRDFANWLYLTPGLLFFTVYQAAPILGVLWMSFTDYHYLRQSPSKFIGFENYANVISDPIFHLGLLRAATFTVIFVPICICLPLFVAILVDRVTHPTLSAISRLVLLIPAVIPGAMIFILWRWLLDFEIGPVNVLLVDYLKIFTFRSAPQWVGDSPLALPTVAFISVWWGLGYHTMFFLAGLAAIPKELFEAARTDGAGEWEMFWYVTLPRLRPVMLILVVLRFGAAMAVVDEFLIMGGLSRGMPTFTWTVYMYQISFKLGEWFQGYAASIGWLGAIVMLGSVTLMLYVFRDQD